MTTLTNLRHLQHVLILAEELNFGRAATRASLSQTAFSRSIQVAEDRFGLRLFDRDTRTVRVTPAGVQLIASARKLLGQATDLSRQIDDIANAEGGHLAIGATLVAVDGVLLEVLPRFRQQRPRLELTIEVGHWQSMFWHLEQELIEFYVGYPGPLGASPDIELMPLPLQPASIFCRTGHPLVASDTPVTGNQLTTFPWAAVQMPDVLAARVRAALKLPNHVALPLSLTSDNQNILRQAVLTSDTLLFTWRSWLNPDLRSGAVTDLSNRLRPRLPDSAPDIECAIVRLAGRTASPAAIMLMDLVLGTVAA